MPTPPIFNPVPRRRRRRRRRRPPLPSAGVTIVSVTSVSLHEVDFAFSAAVTSVGGAGNEQVVIVTDGSDNTPSAAEQIDATTIRYWFESLPVAGDGWHVDATPDGLDFHGREFVVPQAGTVE